MGERGRGEGGLVRSCCKGRRLQSQRTMAGLPVEARLKHNNVSNRAGDLIDDDRQGQPLSQTDKQNMHSPERL